MKYRKLRIAWSVVWCVVAVLLCVLWVRSHWWENWVAYRTGTNVYGVSMRQGGIRATKIKTTARGWYVGRVPADDSWQWKPHSQFDVIERLGVLYIYIPTWFVVAMSVVLASTPWLRFRFSLRTLLIATTLVAVVLGIAYAMRVVPPH